MRASLWTYPWDLLDEGPERALAQIAEDGGFTGVSLAATYHATKALLPHNPKRKVYFAEDGVAYFRVRPERYGVIVPRQSALVAESDPFAAVARLGPRFGLALHAWTICLHGTPLGLRHPDLTLQTPFGDPLLHSLCPSQPEVRRFIVALCADFCEQYPVQSVELEAVEFMGFVHGFHHEKLLAARTAAEDWLLGLCFCPACLERARAAGLDAAALRQRVQARLLAAFERDRPPAPEPPEALLAADAELAAYSQVREATVRSLVAEIKDALGAVDVLTFASPSGGWLLGNDPAQLAAVVDGVVTNYFRDSAAGQAGIAALREQLRGKPVYGAVSATHPAARGGAPEVAERIAAYLAAGAAGVNVYNYGLSPLPYLRAAQRALAAGRPAG